MDAYCLSSQTSASISQEQHLAPSSTYVTHISADFSPSVALLATKQSPSYPQSPPRAATSSPPTSYIPSSDLSPRIARPLSTSHLMSPSPYPYTSFSQQETADPRSLAPAVHEWTERSTWKDPYKYLHNHNIGTKAAWMVIPASEGFRILDLCKSMSIAVLATDGKLPCYNRETLFDEEWQTHMKDIHGVFLIWPETWVRRIEVLDLDAFEGDIVAVNDIIMSN
ncbi:hypothetical protein D0Z07_5086 [Hyphodiscus hymeniophilus]|uniref:Uncharacterized protein n=1 Tax=Hyphodiscus hymeniophilus TaxID=353542 RepID=A0A9P6VJ53_9HELO|nr:hypothetical protein D0Z07_5086 [Hyphodiscus hymeniophilus]